MQWINLVRRTGTPDGKLNQVSDTLFLYNES